MNGIGDFHGKIGEKLVGKLVKTVYQLLDAKFAGFLYFSVIFNQSADGICNAALSDRFNAVRNNLCFT